MILYHTVKDKGNIKHIKKNAPFLCIRPDAWLGKGYYFWDTFICNAHWWGKSAHNDNYIILEYESDPVHISPKCYDLVGNSEHRQEFSKMCELIKEQRAYTSPPTVNTVIRFIQETTKFLDEYEGIRALATHCKSARYSNTIPFKDGERYTLELDPPIQVCLFRKHSFNLRCGQIVYPSHYIDGRVM